jgi:hypothetical protein
MKTKITKSIVSALWRQLSWTHLKTYILHADGELQQEPTYKKFLRVQTEGKRQVERNIDHCCVFVIFAHRNATSIF